MIPFKLPTPMAEEQAWGSSSSLTAKHRILGEPRKTGGLSFKIAQEKNHVAHGRAKTTRQEVLWRVGFLGVPYAQ